jgi:glycosyltransferase involved in cell wall biosynthesis
MGSKVTLGIPLHNSAPFLDELFTCLRGLDPAPAEIIFLDDASNDDSAARVDGFLASGAVAGARLVRSERNLGIAGAYNRLAQEASSEWIQVLDADDLIAEPDFFARVDNALNNDADLVVTALRSNARVLNACARALSPLVPRRPPAWWPLLGSFATRAGVLYRRARLLALPFPDPAYPGSDVIHLLKLRNIGRCIYNSRAHVFYRVHRAAQSSQARDYTRYRSELGAFGGAVRFTHRLDLTLRRLGQAWAR